MPLDRELTHAADLPADIMFLESSTEFGAQLEPKSQKKLKPHFPTRWGWCVFPPSTAQAC